MGSFFEDALGDPMISGGALQVTSRRVLYIDGIATYEGRPQRFFVKKSVQPLTPTEAQLQGFADYGVNEFITVYSLKKITMPSKDGEYLVLRFNNKDWFVRKVLPFVWDEGTPFEMGYWETTLSRYLEEELNPN